MSEAHSSRTDKSTGVWRLQAPERADEEAEGKKPPHPRGGDAGGADLSLTTSHTARPRKQEMGWGYEQPPTAGGAGTRPGQRVPPRAACPAATAGTHALSRSPRSRNAELRRRRSRSGSMTGGWRQTAPHRPRPAPGRAEAPGRPRRAPRGSVRRTAGLRCPPARPLQEAMAAASPTRERHHFVTC